VVQAGDEEEEKYYSSPHKLAYSHNVGRRMVVAWSIAVEWE